MRKYIIKRVLIIFPTLLTIVFIVFSIMNLTPGDPARMMLGQNVTPEAVEKLNHELGFDRPFIIRYVDYVTNLLKGDLGNSYRTGRPIFNEIISRLPTTIKLSAISIFLAVVTGIPLGIISAVKQYSLYDILGTSVAMIMASIPGFWFGLVAIFLFALKLGWLPSNGNDTWVHFILPAITLAIPVTAALLRLTRTTMLETVKHDYVRTARAKGQIERKVIFNHALKNALLPVVTVAGLEFGGLLGGVVTIETVFSINGVGTLIIDAIRMKDVPQVSGCAIFLASLFMIVMLIIDILYAYIDPRIMDRYNKS